MEQLQRINTTLFKRSTYPKESHLKKKIGQTYLQASFPFTNLPNYDTSSINSSTYQLTNNSPNFKRIFQDQSPFTYNQPNE